MPELRERRPFRGFLDLDHLLRRGSQDASTHRVIGQRGELRLLDVKVDPGVGATDHHSGAVMQGTVKAGVAPLGPATEEDI